MKKSLASIAFYALTLTHTNAQTTITSNSRLNEKDSLTNRLIVGDYISLHTTGNGSKIIAFGLSGPIQTVPTTCIKSYTVTQSAFSRIGVLHAGSPNMLDFNNDGSNGFIDYGYDVSLHPDPSGGGTATPVPALKLNSACYGDVEIAKGGGFVSTGKYFEIGSPSRSTDIASNIFTNAKIGQRITVNALYGGYPNAAPVYNTQFFVNKNSTKALAVFSTFGNMDGEENFVVYGDGRTHIGKGRPLVPGTAAKAMLSVDGLILAKEIKVAIAHTHWADYVFDKEYKLKPLQELENYILKHKHLPDMYSAEEVKEKGVNLLEMDATLLMKIEELTLYLIEQNKRVNKLETENQMLKQQLIK